MKFTVYLQPNAKISEVSGKHGDHIKIKIKAPAIDGKANAALIAFLAEKLQIPKSSVTIVAGKKSRLKTVCIENVDDRVRLEKILGIARCDEPKTR